MTRPLVLDVRTIPPPRRHPEIFAAFDALDADESFVLVNDHYPRPLLFQFQDLRSGQFDWNVLEAGPALFRVEIRRRGEPGLRTVTDYLTGDHRRLDAIIPEVERSLAAGAFAEAARQFAAFTCGLNRHIDIEEKLLFPTFERLTGMTGGPTVVMRTEHVGLRRHLDDATATIERQDAAGATAAIRAALELLGSHNMKEEQMLYPMFDRAVGDPDDLDACVRDLQTF